MKRYDYSDYESQLMDSEYIRMLQRPRVQFFRHCKRVLDLACGPGIFLELLKEAGIEALGVDRNEEIVKKVRLKHLEAVHADVFDFLEKSEEKFDGIFCSHLLEHLPFDQVLHLIERVAVKLNPEGVLALVLPNPGSIRLHLFGFWRDPEHVRFYTGNLIASVCKRYGFLIEYCNEDETPNLLETPHLEPIKVDPLSPVGRRFLPVKREKAEILIEEFNRKVEEFNQKMNKFSEALNKIWARDDEVVIVARKQMERAER